MAFYRNNLYSMCTLLVFKRTLTHSTDNPLNGYNEGFALIKITTDLRHLSSIQHEQLHRNRF